MNHEKNKKKISRQKLNDHFWGYLFIFPFFAGIIVFFIGPVFLTLFYSFTDWGALGSYTWTGLENYIDLFRDPEFWLSLKNTFIYTFGLVPFAVVLATLIAVLLNQNIKGVQIYRTLFFLPVVTMPVAVAMIWGWLYNSDYGLINHFLNQFGINGPSWLTNPNLALYSIIVVGIWSVVGYNMVILLAGMQTIPADLYEVADIDGAGQISKFFRITLPLLSPTIFFVTVTSVINSFQAFDLIYLMVGTEGAALEESQTLVLQFYRAAFIQSDKGYGSAMIFILFIIIFIFTIIQFKLQKKWVHY